MAPRTRNRPKKKYMTVQSVTEKLAKKQVLDKLCHDAITAQANSKNNKLPYGYLKSILDKDEFNIKKEDYSWYKVSSFKNHLYALQKKKIQQADNPDGLPLRTVLAPLVVAAKKGIKGDGKMPLTRSGLMERYQQWVVVEKRKRKIVENVEISVADQLANEATEGAGEPVSASDSAPSQDPTDVNDDASVSGRVLLGIDEPIGGSQSSTSVTNGVNDPAEVSF